MTIITGDGFDIFDHSNGDNGSNQNGDNKDDSNKNGDNKNGDTKNADNKDDSNKNGDDKNTNRGKRQKSTHRSSSRSKGQPKAETTTPKAKADAGKADQEDAGKADQEEVGPATTDTGKTDTGKTDQAKTEKELPLDIASVAAAPAAEPVADSRPLWSGDQIAGIARRALAVLVVFGVIGYGLGALRGENTTARAEFVYSLDESIPDSFLREDRRLLTQLVTFKSDAVLAPVAADFNLTVDALRSKIDVATLELSEVIRLDVSDTDAARAVAINEAVLDQYLQVINDATPADDGRELAARRTEIADQLATADASRLALLASQGEDVTLELRQESIQRQVDQANERINVLQQNLDSADLGQISAAQAEAVTDSLGEAKAELVDLEAELIDVGTQRAELSTATRSEPALEREIARLESQLATVDTELAQRELGPLVASPIRELNEPLVVVHSRHLSGLQGMAAGLLLAVPFAALVAYRSRKWQLWFD